MTQSPEERRKAINKRKRADRKAATKAKRADAQARDERIQKIKDEFYSRQVTRTERLQAFLNGTPAKRPPIPPELERWNWDSRIKPPEAGR